MAHVVFLRAVNLGGRSLGTKALAADLDLANVGAAGTFVATDDRSPDALEDGIRRRLPFETEVMVVPGDDVLRLLSRDAFGPEAAEEGAGRFVSVLARSPASPPPLPLDRPEGAPWQVRLVSVDGPFALTLRRRLGPRTLYSNEVVEKALGVPATTRGWETFVRIGRVLGTTSGPTG